MHLHYSFFHYPQITLIYRKYSKLSTAHHIYLPRSLKLEVDQELTSTPHFKSTLCTFTTCKCRVRAPDPGKKPDLWQFSQRFRYLLCKHSLGTHKRVHPGEFVGLNINFNSPILGYSALVISKVRSYQSKLLRLSHVYAVSHQLHSNLQESWPCVYTQLQPKQICFPNWFSYKTNELETGLAVPGISFHSFFSAMLCYLLPCASKAAAVTPGRQSSCVNLPLFSLAIYLKFCKI